ncbi:hypothetical protein [Idiomarina seosinensis]|uniref:Capsule assembly Wzi family protein n=1 Tax=Idiomarina seosinensis TaxID=281739 RepID=A0A432ZGJ4_9GAMM|nr:hypothetical protein [Idiomarina seosinensis]RUO76940.1 hypothetical protein CWI81_00060 [Idiomarina seosinensis]
MKKRLSFAIAVLFSSAALSTPWLAADDAQLRHALQVLSNAGVTVTPSENFPLMWHQIHRQLLRVDVNDLSETELAAYDRLFNAANFARDGYTGGKLTLQNDTGYPQGFAQVERAKAHLELTREFQSEHYAARLVTNFRHDAVGALGGEGDTFSLEGTYLAARAGQWAVSLEQLPLWWSPSMTNDGLNTVSATPLQKVRLSGGGDSGVGRWDIQAFAGQSEDKLESINDRENGYGFRVALAPSEHWQYAVQWTRSDLVESKDSYAVSARVSLPAQLSAYGYLRREVYDDRSLDNNARVLGADYSFSAYGFMSKVFVERFSSDNVDYNAVGLSAFSGDGRGIDIRLSDNERKRGSVEAYYPFAGGRARIGLNAWKNPQDDNEFSAALSWEIRWQ